MARRRIELDRFELLVLSGILVLFSGLMFTFGVLVGYGVKKSDVAVVPHATHGEEEVAEAEEADDRTPASEKEEHLPGDSLRKAFRESKQQALVETVLAEKEGGDEAPKSIADEEAHFGANTEWDRKPASAPEPSTRETRAEKLAKTEDEREKKGPPQTVRSLFERRADSKDMFEPASGLYTLQLGSFSTEDEARAKVVALRQSGFPDAYFRGVVLGNGDRWFQVGLGSYKAVPQAKTIGKRLVQRKLASDFFVKKIP